MSTKGEESEQDVTKQFLVKCENCPFERTATGRHEATQVGNGHRRETRHELIAVEVPRSIDSP
ncbi:hypothetical protein [Natrinema salifodinae]|uniref:Uncharacterized protein n=1 Tax=Natrinema salifodinae TaxID=1202768 RepID=A0A1I0QVS3_9EURY|nr:hypothetical protein [Natrinema salifodinae]SEW31679.1 hypothetical protein SAMN05216285_4034 [Natrinema salifodinae]